MNKDIVSYYDAIAAEYDSSRFGNSYGRFIDAEERRILDCVIGEKQGRQVLEMACGTGRLTGYATHALDASEEMMAFARKRCTDVQFVRASATDSGFPDGMFDIVYSFHLLMHLDVGTVRQFIDEAYRILKPGGRLIIDIPSGKRRRLLRHERKSWHGATALTSAELKEMVSDKFSLHRSFGIMMLPVHRLPKVLRRPLLDIDYALANGRFMEYSSYMVFELTKNK
ncbi:MAG: class I SAM-dependent methyltransferase [Paraprevotella sp.]|nr:class I SAM-dependent methyltransferase [Paraprevotella sp.]